MRCASCGADNDDANRFCSACGNRLTLACTQCDFENTADANFCGGCGTRLKNESAPAAAPPATPAAERRQITVMFCDLVGSTELSAQMDPEDLSQLYRLFRDRVEQVMETYGGYVAEYLGDGIVVYFGYPVASENAASRCVQAALATVQTIETMTLPETFSARLSVRIGIATGLVVAGDLLGTSDQSQVRTVIGETPNLAARLQSIAEPNTVIIGSRTRRLVESEFALEALEPVKLKGIADEVTPYRVQDLAPASAMDAAIAQDRGLIGREEELRVITERWQQVVTGRGQTLLISGEPGLGKSRLVRALNEQIQHEDHLWLTLQASDLHQNSAFHPIIDLLRSTFGFSNDPSAAVEGLTSALADAGETPDEVLPLICELLSVPYDGSDGTTGLSAEARRRRVMTALTRWVLKLSEAQPLVLVAEDLHWIDPSTLELLAAIVAGAVDARVLVITTFRPEFESPWHETSRITLLPLAPLSREETERLVAEFANGAEISPELLSRVSSRTDGVPLFVEQLTQAVVEESSSDDARDDLPSIPSTLQDSLMARLDRLGEAKDVAQRAAIIGREFSYDMLQAMSGLTPQALDAALGRLVDAKLVLQQGNPPQASYSFRHALIQDTAYQSLLNRNRRALHGNLADVLTEQFPEFSAREPEVVAQHFANAGRIPAAVPYFVLAGQSARERSALLETVSHLKAGLSWLEQLTETDDRSQLELSLLLPLSGPLIATSGYSNPEVEEICTRAVELCNEIGDDHPDLPFAIYGLTTYYLNASRLDRCREVCEMLMACAEQPEFELHEVSAHLQLAFVNFFSGNLETSLAHSKATHRLYQHERIGPLAARYGQDPGPTAYAQAALTAWQLGQVDLALDYGRTAWTLPQEHDDPFTQAAGGVYLTLVHIARREREQARQVAEQTLALCEHQSFVAWGNQAKVAYGWTLADGSATTAEGLAMMQEGLGQLAHVGSVIGAPMFVSLLVEALMVAGMHEVALGTVTQALDDSQDRGNVWMDAELLRLKAELLLATDPAARAEARTLLEQSMAEARRTGSRSYELRSICTAHRLNIDNEADRARLAELARELPEGRDTPEHQEMAAILAAAG